MIDKPTRKEDEMIRVSENLYSVVRLAAVQYKRMVKDIADEALREWIEKHIPKDDKKLFDQMINKRSK